MTSISGVNQIGIRFMWLPLYKIRPHGTKPQALTIMSLILILILVALNVILYALAPDYTTYGSQKYLAISPYNTTKLLNCDDEHAPIEECTMTRVSMLLLAFHTKAWIFGATFYWLTWAFVVILCVGIVYSLVQCRRRRPQVPDSTNSDQEDLLHD